MTRQPARRVAVDATGPRVDNAELPCRGWGGRTDVRALDTERPTGIPTSNRATDASGTGRTTSYPLMRPRQDLTRFRYRRSRLAVRRLEASSQRIATRPTAA